MLADGTSMLFTLRDDAKLKAASATDTSCDRIDPTDNQINTTSCMSFLYDVNGFGKPNIIGKDINVINADVATCVISGSLCVDVADLPAPITPINTCTGSPDAGWSTRGSADINCASNRWAAAKKACAAKGMRLPTGSGSTNNEIYYLFQNKDAIGGFSYGGVFGSFQYVSDTDIGMLYLNEAFVWGVWFDPSKHQTDWTRTSVEQVRARCVKNN